VLSLQVFRIKDPSYRGIEAKAVAAGDLEAPDRPEEVDSDL
jgi:hypothetical protein